MGLCPMPQSEPEVPTLPELFIAVRETKSAFFIRKADERGKVQGTQFPVGVWGRAPKKNPKEETYAYRKS